MKKTRVVVIVVLLVICVAFGATVLVGSQLGIHQFLGSNSDSAQEIATSMLDYTLPAGYLEQGGRDVGIIKMALITPGGQDPQFLTKNVILITTLPSVFGLTQDQFHQELRLAILRSATDVSTIEFVREGTTTIQGTEITLQVYESFGAHDPPTRMVFSSAFPGKSENVVLVFAGPIASWDQRTVDQFMKSIR